MLEVLITAEAQVAEAAAAEPHVAEAEDAAAEHDEMTRAMQSFAYGGTNEQAPSRATSRVAVSSPRHHAPPHSLMSHSPYIEKNCSKTHHTIDTPKYLPKICMNLHTEFRCIESF